MISFKEAYYQALFDHFIKELAESGMSLTEEINAPFVALLETSLYKALDLTFSELDKKVNPNG